MTPEQERIIEKVLKLMELGKEENAGTEGERASANAMAAKLMATYSIDFADLRSNKPKTGMFQQFDMNMDRDVVNWQGSLANVISVAFDVKVVQRTRPTWTLMFLGTKSDIEISVFFFKYVRRSVGVLSSRLYNKKADQETFAYAMVDEIGRRMKDLYMKRNEVMESDGRALMVIKTDELAKFVQSQFPSLRKGRATTLRGSQDAYAAGREAGKSVNLSRPIAGSSKATQQIK